MNNTITRIQLIGTISGYLDVDQRVPAPINYAISDIREPTSRTGSFSKNIVLPGTKNNNELLSYLFDVNVAEGTFNIKKLYKCYILQDNVPVTDNELNLQLLAVNKIQDNFTEDDEISYDVVVRDDVGQFFTSVSNKNLQDLSFTELNHNINAANIISSWSHSYNPLSPNTNYKYILPYKDDRNWLFYEPIPGIYARYYFDKIHSDSGFSYQFFNNQEPDFFNDLIIPSNRLNEEQTEIARIENDIQLALVGVLPSANTVTTVGNATFDPGSGEFRIGENYNPVRLLAQLRFNLKIKDQLNQFLVPFTWSPALTTSNNYVVDVSFEYDWQINNPTPFNITVQQGGTVLPITTTNTVEVRNVPLAIPGPPGSVNSFSSAQTSIVQDAVAGTYPPGLSIAQGSITSVFQDTFTVNTTNIGSDLHFTFNAAFNKFLRSTNPFDVVLRIRNLRLNISLDSQTLILNQNIDMNLTIPDISQSEFLKSLYTMYNLYCVPDRNNPNRLIYYTRDEFYRNGNNLDWTLKLDRSSEQKVEFLPELRNRELQLSYKEDNDEANEFYRSYTGKTYGAYEKEFDIEWTKGIDRRELAFSPTPGGQNSFGFYLPYLTSDTNPRILIDGGLINGQTFAIISDRFPLNFLTSAQYPFFSHFNRPTNPSFDINFSFWPEFNPYYFYDVRLETRNNLFNLFWRNTINQIQIGKLLTAYFWLTPTDIQGLNLNDTIRIDNSYWNINRIIDYDAASKKLTKVELISTSELLPPPIIPPVEPEEPGEPEEPEE
jgi:hypothetical protein